jgi:hypothetical protein
MIDAQELVSHPQIEEPELCSQRASTPLAEPHQSGQIGTLESEGGILLGTTREPSPCGITEPSHLPLWSSSSSFSDLSIDGDIATDCATPMTSVTCRSIRKRPRISDLQQHASTSKIPIDKQPARQDSPSWSPRPKRRCASANAALRAHSRFTSPDRYVPQRPTLAQDSPSYRTSKPPSSLRGRELYTRSRDLIKNPFRSTSDRSAEVARRLAVQNPYGLRLPRYTPSFVTRLDATSPVSHPGDAASPTRQLSWGGFWTVGGRRGAQLGQLHPVPTVLIGQVASGTNAPIHTPTFLDAPTKDDIIQAHERRLALAMGIDQASRILRNCPPAIQDLTTSSGAKGLKWRDNTWTADQTVTSKRCYRVALSLPG